MQETGMIEEGEQAMGIFDGADQKQITAAQKIFVNPTNPNKQAAQVFAQQAQMQAYNQAALTGIGGYATQAQAKRFNPNESEAYQIPLSQLVAMWQVKYGDQWAFTGDDKSWDDFYVAAEARLQLAGLFEHVQGWVRLKENVEKLLANC